MAHRIQYPAKAGRDVCYLAIHHFSQCPMANALFFFPSGYVQALLYSEELLPSRPPQMVMKTWKCNFCRVQNKMGRVILTGRRRHCMQLLVPAAPTRSQAIQLCQRQHNRSRAGWEIQAKHAHVDCQVCQTHADVSTNAPGFSFLPRPMVISSVIGMAQLTLSPWSSSIPSTE